MCAIERAYQSFAVERFALINENAIQALEQRIKVALPDDYREYLLQYNGGNFNEPSFRSPDGEGPSDALTFMHGIGAPMPLFELGREKDLAIWDDNEAFFEDGKPPEIVPIGYTLCGYFILLVTHPDDFGCILHRTFEESFFLADGIGEFFELLGEG